MGVFRRAVVRSERQEDDELGDASTACWAPPTLTVDVDVARVRQAPGRELLAADGDAQPLRVRLELYVAPSDAGGDPQPEQHLVGRLGPGGLGGGGLEWLLLSR